MAEEDPVGYRTYFQKDGTSLFVGFFLDSFDNAMYVGSTRQCLCGCKGGLVLVVLRTLVAVRLRDGCPLATTTKWEMIKIWLDDYKRDGTVELEFYYPPRIQWNQFKDKPVLEKYRTLRTHNWRFIDNLSGFSKGHWKMKYIKFERHRTVYVDGIEVKRVQKFPSVVGKNYELRGRRMATGIRDLGWENEPYVVFYETEENKHGLPTWECAIGGDSLVGEGFLDIYNQAHGKLIAKYGEF